MQLPWKTLLALMILMWLPLVSLPQPSHSAKLVVESVEMATGVEIQPSAYQSYAFVNSRWLVAESFVSNTYGVTRFFNLSNRTVLLTHATAGAVGQCVTKFAPPIQGMDAGEKDNWELITELPSLTQPSSAATTSVTREVATAASETQEPLQSHADQIHPRLPSVSAAVRPSASPAHSTKFSRRYVPAPFRTALGRLHRARF